MGKITGFLDFARQETPERELEVRIADFGEIYRSLSSEELSTQGSRCMDCSVPYCQSGILLHGMTSGCPTHNLIPEWNDLVYRGAWKDALNRLFSTNNFPEFTGRVCPAPCEGSCTAGLHGNAVTIKQIEREIVERGFREGWVQPRPPKYRTGKQVAVVGSGPAGLAAAAQLNSAGHWVTVFERADRPGGLLTYGIPNMKLDKDVVARRVKLMEAEGVRFVCHIEIGVDYAVDGLKPDFDAVVLSIGANKPRDLDLEGRELAGIHFAMDFLRENTRHLLSGDFRRTSISAQEKHVIVIGGGDTGTDCVATALRQGCRGLVQLEVLEANPSERPSDNPWPEYPQVYKVDYGQAEARNRFGQDPRAHTVATKRFIGNNSGMVVGVDTIGVSWKTLANGQRQAIEIPGTEATISGDLVLLALGYLGPEDPLLDRWGVQRNSSSNIQAPYGSFATSIDGVFAAGDARRGQSLVVWAINEGRACARECDRYLMGSTDLP